MHLTTDIILRHEGRSLTMRSTSHFYVSLVQRGNGKYISDQVYKELSKPGSSIIPTTETVWLPNEGDTLEVPNEPVLITMPWGRAHDVFVIGVSLEKESNYQSLREVMQKAIYPGIILAEKHVYRVGQSPGGGVFLDDNFDLEPEYMVHTTQHINNTSPYIELIGLTIWGKRHNICIDAAQLITAGMRMERMGMLGTVGGSMSTNRSLTSVFARVMQAHADLSEYIEPQDKQLSEGMSEKEQILRMQLARCLEADVKVGPVERGGALLINDDYSTGSRIRAHLHETNLLSNVRENQGNPPDHVWSPFKSAAGFYGGFVMAPSVTPSHAWTRGGMNIPGKHIDREYIYAVQDRGNHPKRRSVRSLRFLTAMNVSKNWLQKGAPCVCHRHFRTRPKITNKWRGFIGEALCSGGILKRVRQSKAETYALDLDLRLEFGIGLGKIMAILNWLIGDSLQWGLRSDPLRSDACGLVTSDHESWLQNLKWGR